MAERVKGMVFEIEVDSATGAAKLKSFENQATGTFQKVSGEATKSAGGVRSLDDVFNKLNPSSLLAAAGIGALAVAALDATRKFTDFVAWGEKAGNVMAGFATITAQAGLKASSALEELKRGTRGLVDDTDLMQIANQALIQGLPLTQKNIGQLAADVTRLGESFGFTAQPKGLRSS